MSLLRLLGHPVLERDGMRTPVGVPPKGLVLAALLAANAARPLARDWLAQAIWPDLDPPEARANLRRNLHLLGKTLGEDALVLSRHTAQWNAAGVTSVDVVRFDEFAKSDPVLAIAEYGGDLCAGIDDEAVSALRHRYRFAYESLLRTRIESARKAGDDAELAVWLQHAVNHDSYDESAVRQIMELRMRHGDRTGALREFNALAQRLRSELDTEPGPETAELFTQIAGASPELRAPNNLPNPSTTFVGREQELADVLSAIRGSRLVTLVGPGGIGKSRLALHAAFNLLPEHTDGVWFVSLEHAGSERSVWEHVASALRLDASASPDRSTLEALRESNALLLLDTCEHVLENARSVVERLLGASGVRVLATSRRRLNTVHEQALDLAPLSIPPEDASGERAMRFAAYRLFVERATAVSPAFRVEPRQTRALRDVLTRIDGLPLAIELVASRANVLTIEGMRKRLSTAIRAPHRSPASARAQTIDDTIAWSYDLLTADQRHAFCRLSTFEGAFDLDDAERLCADIPSFTESLFELVDASLVSIAQSAGDVLYRFLDTTRDFARRRLRDGRDALPAAMRHAEVFAAKADALAALPDNAFATVLDCVLAAMPDYLAALAAAAAHDWPALGLRLLEGVYRFGCRDHFSTELLEATLLLHTCASMTDSQRARVARLAGMQAQSSARYATARAQLEIAVAHYAAEEDSEQLCEALGGIAVVAFHLGQYDECERRLLEVRDVAQNNALRLVRVKTLGRLGALYLAQGRFEEAVPLLEAAAIELPQFGESRQVSIALKNLATAAHYAGRHLEAVRWANQALVQSRETSDLGLHANTLCVRASAERELGRTRDSLASLLEACRHMGSAGESGEHAECMEDIASTLTVHGEFEAAARIIGYADELRRRIGSPQNAGLQTYTQRTAVALERALGGQLASFRSAGAAETAQSVRRLAMETLERALGRLEDGRQTEASQ